MRRLIKPLVIFVLWQAVGKVLRNNLRSRYQSDDVGEDGVNAIGVVGGTKEKVTSQHFTGGYLRAIIGGVELDLSEAAIKTAPATIEATIVLGGAQIKVPNDWVVKVEADVTKGGFEDKRTRAMSSQDASPDLVITGKVSLGGLAITS